MNVYKNEIISIAKRENNNKRKYLVVNRIQGKHIPTNPENFMNMTKKLSDIIKSEYENESVVIIGFAETATAIGASLAINIGSGYIHTTREVIKNVEWLYFTESHSHATEQKLLREDIEKLLDKTDRIIFAEDEVTTGNTILKIIDIIEKKYGKKVEFSIASVINGMDNDSVLVYNKRNIKIHYLIKTDNSNYTEIADKYMEDGEYISKNTSLPQVSINEIKIKGRIDARRYIDSETYNKACKNLWENLKAEKDILKGKNILVIGTEEFMYPAIYLAYQIEKLGFNVKTHSTTRSPISVSKDKTYPLHKRFELVSFYDKDRITYIYNIENYDTVLVITDSQNELKEGAYSLINALYYCENKNIHLIRWTD